MSLSEFYFIKNRAVEVYAVCDSSRVDLKYTRFVSITFRSGGIS